MKLLIVTGMSGAGKSLALNSLEELGFFCVDNLPSPMLGEFARLCLEARPPIQKAAVTIDSRECLLSRSPETIISAIHALTIPYDILFLDARDDVLRQRYNETRRRHPLGEAGDAESGVMRERVFLQNMRDAANYILDTSDTSVRDFRNSVLQLVPDMGTEEMTLIVSSFGYKRGVPVDADIILDMRFIENPFYFTQYRPLSGLDKPVSDFVLSRPFAREYINSHKELLLKMIPLFRAQDKHLLRVCCGCTGGRHRSVAAAEELAMQLKEAGQAVRIYHRDLGTEANDIQRRFEGRQ